MPTDYRMNDWLLTEHEIDVPLDWNNPGDDRRISVFARVVTAADGADRPYLVFLQGGPGFEAPRPSRDPLNPAWLEPALAKYRVVMLDQRGTGRSTPVTLDIGHDAASRAEYLTHLRADSIVRDAEALREHLGVDSWAVLGQSFGGFTLLHYLSTFPQHLLARYFTGGLPPVGRHCDEVYARCYDALEAKSEQSYRRFGEDRAKMAKLVEMAAEGRLRLPGGDTVSPTRLRGLGHLLGGAGGPEALHWLLEWSPESTAFAYDLAHALPFDGRNPLYSVLHESSYADGCVTNWSAERMLPQKFRDDPTLLTGEHLHRTWFSENSALAPWRDVAEIIATHEWPSLYSADVLREVDVPCAAAVYHDDAYVNVQYSLETASLLKNLTPWVTNEFEHNGLRLGSERVMDRLFGLVSGRYSH